MRIRPLTLALSLALLAGAPGALAQDKASPPLQGPKVVPNRPADLEDEFAPSAGKGDKFSRREPPIPMRAYIQAVNKLKGDDTPAALRLTDDQQHKIEAVVQEFRQAGQEAQRRNQSEMDQDRPADRKPEDAKPAEEMDKEAGRPRRARFEAARRGPQPQEYETKIWNTLTESQQKFVQSDLDTLREEQRKRQGEEYMKREVEKRRLKDGKDDDKGSPAITAAEGVPAPISAAEIASLNMSDAMKQMVSRRTASAKNGIDGPTKARLDNEVTAIKARLVELRGAPSGPDTAPSPEMRERAQRILEKLRQLSPEDREQVLRHLEEDIARHSGENDGKPAEEATPALKKKKAALDKPGKGGLRGPLPGDDAKPPPDMDDVKVPRPGR